MGETLIFPGRYVDSDDRGSEAIDFGGGALQTAEVELMQGEIAVKRGDNLKGIRTDENSRRRLGKRVPRSTRRVGVHVAVEGMTQLFHSLFPGRVHIGKWRHDFRGPS